MNTQALCHTLQSARKLQRLSQLELSLRMGVSQRHVSFVESGRARPSRELILAWMHELRAPLEMRNAALLQAGFAPVFGQDQLGDQKLAPARAALTQLLAAQDPSPAMVLDVHWNVLELNKGALWLAKLLMPEYLSQTQNITLNMLDAVLHPKGMFQRLKNWDEVAPLLLAHVREDAQASPQLRSKLDALEQVLQTRSGPKALRPMPAQMAPMLTSRFDSPYGELCFFSLFTTFGSPQHITLASLRVEHICPADSHTQNVLKQHIL